MRKMGWIASGVLALAGIVGVSAYNNAHATDTGYQQQQTNQQQQPQSGNQQLSNDNHYTNSDGQSVHSPAYSNNGGVPSGATAQCNDGTYSFSQHRQGTCSHHGGVAHWL